jgi:hypothetical protein
MIAKILLVFDPNAKIGHKCLEEVVHFLCSIKVATLFPKKKASWVFDLMTPKYTYIHTLMV